MLWLISMFIVGLIAGAIARAVVPGRDPLGCLGTALLGIVGSFIGGTLASLIFDDVMELRATGLVGSIIGAIIALLIYRQMGGSRSARRRR
jgi:uncharacterized membrane protein YeaQ/YmgE (transglycosylase-associated protein family)